LVVILIRLFGLLVRSLARLIYTLKLRLAVQKRQIPAEIHDVIPLDHNEMSCSSGLNIANDTLERIKPNENITCLSVKVLINFLQRPELYTLENQGLPQPLMWQSLVNAL
jgi:hypothetical protein